MISVTRGPLRIQLAEPGMPAVNCHCVASRIEMSGEATGTSWESVRLSPDDAGDLVGSPRGAVELVERRVMVTDLVVEVWRAVGFGFIEAEALAAHDEAVAEIRAHLHCGSGRCGGPASMCGRRTVVEHPAVVFLRQAHERAAELARAARREAPDHCPSDPVEFVLGMCDISTPAIEAAERHIRLHDPAAVLRRVTAERQILAEHGTVHRDIGWLEDGEEEHGEIPVCGLCIPRHSHFQRREDVPEWPCRTILLLAEAWGWTEDVREQAEDMPAAYAAARVGSAQSLRESAELARQQSGAGWSMHGVLCDLQAGLLERPSPFAGLAAELRQPWGAKRRVDPPALGGCYEQSWGWVHVRPGCRCAR